jgi:hypothetical protein
VQDGKHLVDPVQVFADLGLIRGREGPQVQVLPDAQGAEDPPALGNLGQAQLDDVVGFQLVQGLVFQERRRRTA